MGHFPYHLQQLFFFDDLPLGPDQVTVELTAQSSGSAWVRGLVFSEVAGGWVVFGGSFWVRETTGCRTSAEDGKNHHLKTSHDSTSA